MTESRMPTTLPSPLIAGNLGSSQWMRRARSGSGSTRTWCGCARRDGVAAKVVDADSPLTVH